MVFSKLQGNLWIYGCTQVVTIAMIEFFFSLSRKFLSVFALAIIFSPFLSFYKSSIQVHTARSHLRNPHFLLVEIRWMFPCNYIFYYRLFPAPAWHPLHSSYDGVECGLLFISPVQQEKELNGAALGRTKSKRNGKKQLYFSHSDFIVAKHWQKSC